MRMRREELSDLLKRYSEGKCSEREKQLIDSWFDTHDAGLLAGSAPDMQELIWKQIEDRIEPESKPRFSIFMHSKRMLGIAASILLAGAFLFYFFKKQQDTPADSLSLTDTRIEKNETDRIKVVQLEDSSRVALRPGAAIRCAARFEKDKREVFLDGEAFFEVTKNSKRPFIVYCGEVATKVVGTSFLVKPGLDNPKDVEVSVMTGKVIVENSAVKNEKKQEGNGVVLTPNHKVTYYHQNSHFVTTVVEKPAVLQPRKELLKTNLFHFSETPLEQVLEKLQYGYGIKFELLNERIRNCPFTADLSDQPLYTKLDIIAASLNASYEVKGVSIVLSGGSCE